MTYRFEKGKRMKVKELIEELQKCNPDATVEIAVGAGFDIAEVDIANPESCVGVVQIHIEK